MLADSYSLALYSTEDPLSLLVDDDMKVGTDDVLDDTPSELEHTAEYKPADKTGTGSCKKHHKDQQHSRPL